MTRTKATGFALTALALIMLAVAPNIAFAQHGGGHGGGGGFHGGGAHSGGPSSAGGRSYAGPPAGRSYRAAPAAPGSARPGTAYGRPNAGYARPNASYSRPAANGGNARVANRGNAYGRGGAPASGAAVSHEATADGQWHSFAPTSSRAANPGAVRSFVGQGHDLYEEGPHTTSVAPRSLVATNTFATTRTFATARVATSARFGVFGLGPIGAPVLHPGFGFGFGFGAPIFRPRFGFGFGGFGRFGLGFGFGFGWNPCWNAAWAWDDPFCSYGFAPAGYYGYPYPYPPYDPNAYPYPPQGIGPDPNNGPYPGYGPNDDQGNAPADSGSPGASAPLNPNWDTTVNAGKANKPGSVIIYLKDGTSISPNDYWITDNELHYTLGGAENAIDINRVDLRRSNDENAKNGVTFWLKSEPEKAPAPSDESPSAAPAPEPGENATPDSEPQSAPDSTPPTVKLSAPSPA